MFSLQLLEGDRPWGSKSVLGMQCDAMITATTALYVLKHCTTTKTALKSALLVGGDIDVKQHQPKAFFLTFISLPSVSSL